MRSWILPITTGSRFAVSRCSRWMVYKTGEAAMGKGNNSQKNDKKSMKPKQDKKKPAVKK